MTTLNESPTRGELQIEKLETTIKKQDAAFEKAKADIGAQKERADKAEASLEAEKKLHEKTKKDYAEKMPSDEDLQMLHGAKADNILHPIIEKNKFNPIAADEDDLNELGIHPMLHEKLKTGERTETTNIIIEKSKEKLPDGKTFVISSKHSKK